MRGSLYAPYINFDSFILLAKSFKFIIVIISSCCCSSSSVRPVEKQVFLQKLQRRIVPTSVHSSACAPDDSYSMVGLCTHIITIHSLTLNSLIQSHGFASALSTAAQNQHNESVQDITILLLLVSSPAETVESVLSVHIERSRSRRRLSLAANATLTVLTQVPGRH